ncbi:hypothetical protein EDD17DRAFT_793072 [Pisolithus thermaeus]|nr:hypothetical protein EDD17DRAFT_793072 [Pisolithus thermaeus]
MSLEGNETPWHCAGPATIVSSLAGAVEPSHPAIAQNQYRYFPSEDNETLRNYVGPATSVSSLAGAVEPFRPAINQYRYFPSEDNETPRHYTGPATRCVISPWLKHFLWLIRSSVSSLAGAVEPLQRAVAQNQYSHFPLEDNETPQHYAGPATSVSSLAGAVEPFQPAIAQNQCWDYPSEDNETPQLYAGTATRCVISLWIKNLL